MPIRNYPFSIARPGDIARPYLPVKIMEGRFPYSLRRYQDTDWQIENISPQEISVVLLLNKTMEQYNKMRQ